MVQSDGILPSGSDFVTSGDESGGSKAQRRRVSKDKPRRSRMKHENGDVNGDMDTAIPGDTCLHHVHVAC